MGLRRPARAQRPTILLVLILASGLFALSPSRWAHSERAQPEIGSSSAGLRHGVTRAIKADIGALSTLQTFDSHWSMGEFVLRRETSPESLPEMMTGSLPAPESLPIINFAAADPVDAAMAPFEAVMSAPQEALPVLQRGLLLDPLEFAAISSSEQKCLADAVYFEARGESLEGQIAVAQVVLNRVDSRYYPNTICGVVYQNQDKLNRCQFSFACDGRAETIADKGSWRRAVDVARKVLLGGGATRIAAVGSATHYHATSVSPVWAGEMNKVDVIGSHIFYQRRSSRS
ncbi:cell wall hydrolase [Bauldia litoralis]|uniref:Cell Wall Hydrolase n=1 Tax=Bauldia litoralis TaxID=665467 RepID=A0A1G6DZG5_9HYPH|nr:Cell Wall Hydrolase [Bauldia litoralis]